MKENMALIGMKEYEDLKKFKEKIERGNTLILKRYFGSFNSYEEFVFLSSDESLSLAEETNNSNSKLLIELGREKINLNNEIIDLKIKVSNLETVISDRKAMSFIELLKMKIRKIKSNL